MQQDVVFGLRRGNEVLLQIRSDMTLESIARLVEDSAAGIAYQKEVAEMLAGAMSSQEEDAVGDELERMEREAAGEVAAAAGEAAEVPVLPAVPGDVSGEREREAGKRDRAQARARVCKEGLERAAAAEGQEPMLA